MILILVQKSPRECLKCFTKAGLCVFVWVGGEERELSSSHFTVSTFILIWQVLLWLWSRYTWSQLSSHRLQSLLFAKVQQEQSSTAKPTESGLFLAPTPKHSRPTRPKYVDIIMKSPTSPPRWSHMTSNAWYTFINLSSSKLTKRQHYPIVTVRLTAKISIFIKHGFFLIFESRYSQIVSIHVFFFFEFCTLFSLLIFIQLSRLLFQF